MREEQPYVLTLDELLPQLSAAEVEQVRSGQRLLDDFAGRKIENVALTRVPTWPRIVINIGLVDGILYSAERDGKLDRYVHRFKPRARPMMAVRPDGQAPVLLIGGSYDFTELGIVDK